MNSMDAAWFVLKSLPDTIIPIGEHDGRKIVLLQGKPYYQSKGESESAFGKKVEGSWQPFGGVEPDANKWMSHVPVNQEWYMKGAHPDIPPHAQNIGADEDIRGNYINQHAHKIKEWEPLINAQHVNEQMAQHGWESPIKGEYPTGE
ncbi:MAG: hypothetical protein HOC79_05430 [Euryarchaeota archaeon]|mgnify:CR=1 FL=1|jgi:hypothetical protein|nr:hypothetical protein [Euryarchaeota archaeon]